MEMHDHKRRRYMILYVLIAFVVYLVLSTVLFPNMGQPPVTIEDMSYSQLVKDLEKKKVTKLDYTTDDA